MSDTGWDLQRAYDEGYKDGKRDSASPWHRVEEEPIEIEYKCCMVYSSETRQMVSGVWTEFGWMIPGPIGKITHYMPIEPPKEDANADK